MEILFSRLHHIDFETGSVNLAAMKEDAIKRYIGIIIKDTLENKNSRNFKVKDNTTQVISIVDNFVKCINLGVDLNDETLNSDTEKIAFRLSEKEKEKDDQIAKMDKHVKKGSLIQALVKKDDDLIYILAKVEYMEFLDRSEADFRIGLPVEKKILKTCLIYYNNESEIEKIHIYDSTNNIADYWSNGLLELEEASSNEVNTRTSFSSIDKVLGKNIKNEYQSDYTLLRNSLIAYYNQNESFVFSDLVDKVFKNYKPNDSNLDMNKICEKIEKLPESKKFETNFTIVPKEIRARKKRIIAVNRDIDLILKDSTDNLKGTIKGIHDEDGEYYIKIRVGQEVFKNFDYE